ncbi:MAG: prephenate dehydrogenase/arogenate dehydrogenase family protein [Spirochaetaceae bacterium]|jgi:prephenate dehydrogenase|nr:prephenate dehydrogenase/arogenate dehydrogenase family protein [Spirochaetaceae bacterium]
MEVGVFGLGRFGAFWAELLSKKMSIKAYNRSDRPTPPGIQRCTLDELGKCDIIFLCSAISSMDVITKELSPHLKEGALVADTCSVKVLPQQIMENNLPGFCSIMGTHPMFGPDSAANGVKNLPMVLSPVRISDEELLFWKNFFSSMEMLVLTMSAEEHDKEAAYTQGVTHFIGRMLSELKLKDSSIATKGYKTLQEIVRQTCNDPRQLFLDLQSYNPYTATMREELEIVMNKMMKQFDAIKTQGDDLG